MRLYLDGTFVALGDLPAISIDSAAPLFIGTDPSHAGAEGTIDEVIVWNRELGSDEIAVLAAMVQ
jgi:hypothetical protein